VATAVSAAVAAGGGKGVSGTAAEPCNRKIRPLTLTNIPGHGKGEDAKGKVTNRWERKRRGDKGK